MRTILHSDCNNFYASVACVYHPELRGKPIAVCGDPQKRHGIVLAKSDAAKKCGVCTGETIWAAKQKCPDLMIIPPDGEKYVRFSHYLRSMYAEYSNQVEPFGLDECWLDVSGNERDGLEIAALLRRRAKQELGITLSVGVSFNKVFAKLGSDLHKPDATTVISPENYRQKIWPLPAEALLFIGRATTRRLHSYGLRTIGDIVHSSTEALRSMIGKGGDTLYAYAAGEDDTPVLPLNQTDDVKSIGNSTTPAFDIVDMGDARRIISLLCDSVAERMRRSGVCCRTVTLGMRDTALHTTTHQVKLSMPTDLSAALIRVGMQLLESRWSGAFPLRSMGIQGSDLISASACPSYSLIPNPFLLRQRALEQTADQLRARFGKSALYRGTQQTADVSSACPKRKEII